PFPTRRSSDLGAPAGRYRSPGYCSPAVVLQHTVGGRGVRLQQLRLAVQSRRFRINLRLPVFGFLEIRKDQNRRRRSQAELVEMAMVRDLPDQWYRYWHSILGDRRAADPFYESAGCARAIIRI